VPTIDDVAKAAGVSIATVSRVLNNKDVVKPATKALIKQVISELNYNPSIIAQNLRNQRSALIGIVIPDFTYYYSEILNKIELTARLMGFSVIALSTEKDKKRERECISTLLQHGVEGLLLFSYTENSEAQSFLSALYQKIPIVLMDYQSVLPISCVYTDGYLAIKQLTTAFIREKRERIAIIAEDTSYAAHNIRFQGYLDAFETADLKINPDYIAKVDMGLEAGYEAAGQLLEKAAPPEVIINLSDNAAISVIKYCFDHGINIPRDVEISGFDGIALSNFTCPSLTTIKQPIQKMAEKAIELLLKKIENPKSHSRKVIFQPEYIFRGSTRLENISIVEPAKI
jgi:DNA-binding LacI/PurR family transcriptional regulator